VTVGSTGGSTDGNSPKISKGRGLPADQDVYRGRAYSPGPGRRRPERKPGPEGAIAGIEQQSRSEECRSVSIVKTDAFGAVPVQDRTYKAGDVISIRYEGPKSGPDMRVLLSTTSAVYKQRNGRSGRLITGGRFSGGTPGFCAGPVRPRGAGGGRSRGCEAATTS
jgi:dihydroxy-acid dehydratase